jgi:hypothetical protein
VFEIKVDNYDELYGSSDADSIEDDLNEVDENNDDLMETIGAAE